VPRHRGDHVRGAGLGGVGSGRSQQDRAGAAAPVVAVDDERVHGDLRIPEDHGQRVEAEDREPDRDLTPVVSRGRGGPGQHGEDDAVAGVLEQPAETGRCRVQARVARQDVLGVGVGAVLPHETEDGGQIGGTRDARRHARPETGA
jgi:hypothetical protein